MSTMNEIYTALGISPAVYEYGEKILAVGRQ